MHAIKIIAFELDTNLYELLRNLNWKFSPKTEL